MASARGVSPARAGRSTNVLQKPERLQLFPDTTTIHNDSLWVAGHELADLAARYGTPLYIYDRQTMDSAVRRYRSALRSHYPATGLITYAGKAFLCRAIAEWAAQQDLQLDCSGEGEIALAAAARVPRTSIVVHGVNKSPTDLAAAVMRGGTIVVDHISELRQLSSLVEHGTEQPHPSIWLRLQPGSAVVTHHVHTQTGQTGSKFGMIESELLEAARIARDAGIAVEGIHFHQGSDFRDPAPLAGAIDMAVRLALEARLPSDWHLCPGGGWGVAYHEDELPHPDIEEYVRTVSREIIRRCHQYGLGLPTLHLEPGRSIVARAGVALYRVGAVKRRQHHAWLLVDGGMADNPRFALYGARYSCLPTKGLGRAMSETVSIAGPYCESGDVLIDGLAMPPVQEGELLAVPMSGAYQLSMSSNYNGGRRPAAIWLEAGRSRIIVRRETIEDLASRQISIL